MRRDKDFELRFLESLGVFFFRILVIFLCRVILLKYRIDYVNFYLNMLEFFMVFGNIKFFLWG